MTHPEQSEPELNDFIARTPTPSLTGERISIGDRLLIVLLGAEGMSEIGDARWLREATEEERKAFRLKHDLSDAEYRELTVDGTGRPYWLVTVQESAPEPAKNVAEKYARVRRLLD